MLFNGLQVREVAQQFASRNQEDLRWQAEALEALQEAAEAYLTHLFEDGYVLLPVPPSLMVPIVICAQSMRRE